MLEARLPALLAGTVRRFGFTEFPRDSMAQPLVHTLRRAPDAEVTVAGTPRPVAVVEHRVVRLDEPLPAWSALISLDRATGMPLAVAADLSAPGGVAAAALGLLMPTASWQASAFAHPPATP